MGLKSKIAVGLVLVWSGTLNAQVTLDKFTGFELNAVISRTNEGYDPNGLHWTIYGGYPGLNTEVGRLGVGSAAKFDCFAAGDNANYHGFVQWDLQIPPGPVGMILHPKFVSGTPPTNAIRIGYISDSLAKSCEIWWTPANKIAIGVNGVLKTTGLNTILNGVYQPLFLHTTWGVSSVVTTIIYNGETITDTNAIANTANIKFSGIGIVDLPGNPGGQHVTFDADDWIVYHGTGTNLLGLPDSNATTFSQLPVGVQSLSNWVGGGNGTTNLYKAVRNIPALGGGLNNSGENDTTNIKNTTSGTADTAYFNMTDYTTAGVPSNYTILALQPVARSGEHAASGTETIGYGITSNPVGAANTATVGEDAGAHVADYDNTGSPASPNTNTELWRSALGTFELLPSVVRGIQPTMCVVRKTANTNQVCVDLLAIEVLATSTTSGYIRRHH